MTSLMTAEGGASALGAIADDQKDRYPDAALVAALVCAAADGDERAWQQLVQRFQGMIGAVARRYGLSAADGGEMQQTTWLRLVENIDRIQQPERIGAWLATTARRESLHLLNRAARCSTSLDDSSTEIVDDDAPAVDARILANERDSILRVACERLSPRCQRMLALMLGDEAISYKELSRVLDMPVGALGPTRGRCLEHLRRLVAETGDLDI